MVTAFRRTAALCAIFATLLFGNSTAEALPYDNTNPETSCGNSARTAKSENLYNPYGGAIGQIQLRYSPTCRTAWARIVNYFPDCGENNCSYASVTRNSDGYNLSRYGRSKTRTTYTNQVNDKNVTSYAYGCVIYGGNWQCVSTSSYR